MKFRAKEDDAESRAYWDAVRRGAEEYDKLPAWKKGRPVDEVDRAESATPAIESREDPGERDGE